MEEEGGRADIRFPSGRLLLTLRRRVLLRWENIKETTLLLLLGSSAKVYIHHLQAVDRSWTPLPQLYSKLKRG